MRSRQYRMAIALVCGVSLAGCYRPMSVWNGTMTCDGNSAPAQLMLGLNNGTDIQGFLCAELGADDTCSPLTDYDKSGDSVRFKLVGRSADGQSNDVDVKLDVKSGDDLEGTLEFDGFDCEVELELERGVGK